MVTNVILVVGRSDKSNEIHKLLDNLHDSKTITHVIHDGTGAGLYASAWSRQHPEVAEVEMPVLSNTKARLQANLMLSLTKMRVLAINAEKSHKALLKLAAERGVKIKKINP